MVQKEKVKIGIVGYGFVGQAIDYAFTHDLVDKFYVDPKLNTNIDELCKWKPACVFICAPTPMSDNGTVDGAIVEDAVLKLIEHTDAMIVIKSTVTPDILTRLYNSVHDDDKLRITHNPEFLTENNAKEQFVTSRMRVIGGPSEESCYRIMKLYDTFSLCINLSWITMTPQEAAMVKYGVNSYLGMKVTFMNQIYDSAKKQNLSPQRIINGICNDDRIGFAHSRVPGYDGKRGFGGACLPKDMSAITKFDEDLTLIAESVKINNKMREEYELDEREKSNNINFEDK